MAVVLGINAKAYYSTDATTYTELSNIKDLTINLEKGEADITTRSGGGFRQYAATLKEGGVDFQMVWDTDDAGFTAIKNAYFNDTTLAFMFLDGADDSSGSQGLKAEMTITNFSRTESLEEALMVDVSLKITKVDLIATPSWHTVS